MPAHIRSGLRTALAIAVALSITACATDPQRTRTEGTLVGAGAGAAIGRAITGDDRGTVIGAAIGAVVGLVTGDRVAKKKAEYAKREEALRQSAQRAVALAQSTRAENDQLARDIASLEADVDQLRKVKASAATKKAQLEASEQKQSTLAAAADERLARVREEYSRQEAIVQAQVPAQPAQAEGQGQQASDGFRLVQASMLELETEQRRLELAKEQLRLIDTRRAF